MGGLAELFSGAISMGLGAYLAAVTESDHYAATEKRERQKLHSDPADPRDRCIEILATYRIPLDVAEGVVRSLAKDEESWILVRRLFIQC